MDFDNNSTFKSNLVDWLIEQLANSPDNSKYVFDAILKLELWQEAAQKFLALKRPSFDLSLKFQSHWLTSGHRIRDQINSDSEVAKLLHHMMPKYGGGDKILFRGEKRWNWDKGQIGFCWTDKIEVAEMFAGGVHNGEDGAVILRGSFPSADIISGPEPEQRHSIKDREREFTIDPFCEVVVEVIRCHGPYDETGNYKPEWPLPAETKRRCQR